jgi:hypothetical protein
MNEDEYYLYERRQRRKDKAASYDKPIIWCSACKHTKVKYPAAICKHCNEMEEWQQMSRK